MSVFATQATATLPPRYSSTRPRPPPYKPDLSSPVSLKSPPPIYKTTTVSTVTTTSSRSYSPSPPISTTTEPPQYASIISAPKPQPQPQPTATRRDFPTWKDPYIETDAADSTYQLQQGDSRQQAREEEERAEDSSNWCLGCFWVGPSMQQPFISYYFI
jgi:hypothetical protein